MRVWAMVTASLVLMGCSDASRGKATFSCEASEDESLPRLGKSVVFHYENGFLFVQADSGRADNVCSQAGMLDCQVNMTDDLLTLRQDIEPPQCALRSSVKTTLDVDRTSGEFVFTQENCDDLAKIVVTGLCGMR